MGTNTINNASGLSSTDDVNQYFTALTDNFVPRNNSSGAPEDNAHKLGTQVYRWKEAHITDLYVNGSLFDPDSLGTGADTKNAINSGATRADSSQPDFIRASGSGASCTILATATPLQITANNTSVTVSADIAVSSLTVAPSTNNTCAINDSDIDDSEKTKYTGEHPTDPITIDTVGTEISDRVGQYICLKASTEYMLAYVKDATTLTNVKRGFFFDDSGDPIVRETLNDNDTLTIMSLGWVFLENNGTTVDVTYKSPIWSKSEPASPDTDDYWFDTENRVWKRYSGSAWVTIERMLIGIVVIDQTNCVASRSFDFTKGFADTIELEVELVDTENVSTESANNIVSVYGETIQFSYSPVVWDITANLESGLTEANSTLYYLYITEKGEPVISVERPYDRRHDLKGFYHPYHSWRFVGVAYNDSSGDFEGVNSKNYLGSKIISYSGSANFLPLPNIETYKVTCVGGGGGGGGAGATNNGSNGGNSTFGSYLAAGGGAGGGSANSGTNVNGGSSGGATNADIRSDGQGGSPAISGVGGTGGSSSLGGGGRGRVSGSGDDGGGRGAGGGGGGSASSGSGGGGGAGGTGIRVLQHVPDVVAVARGAGGAGGSGAGGNDGGDGTSGVVIVEYW